MNDRLAQSEDEDHRAEQGELNEDDLYNAARGEEKSRGVNYGRYARATGTDVKRVQRVAEDESFFNDVGHGEWLDSCGYQEFAAWIATALAEDEDFRAEQGELGENTCSCDTCSCDSARWGFNCTCDWGKKHPGTREFTCEFCGLYTAGEPRCNKCEEYS